MSVAAKVRKVVEVVHTIGAGIDGDPCRLVTDYFGEDGEWLARADSWLRQQIKTGQTS